MELSRKTTFDPVQKIWHGPKQKRIYDSDASLGQILHSRMITNPKNIIQINDTEGTIFTNEQVLQMSTRIALSLIDQGLKQTEFVGIIADNTSYVLPVVFGCYFAGIPHHPLGMCLNKDSIVYCWEKTRPRVIFCEGSIYQLVKETLDQMELDCSIYTLNNHLDNVARIDELLTDKGVREKMFLPAPIASGEQTAFVLCSSGSSGLFKTACVAHKRVRWDDEYYICRKYLFHVKK